MIFFSIDRVTFILSKNQNIKEIDFSTVMDAVKYIRVCEWGSPLPKKRAPFLPNLEIYPLIFLPNF